ncbi:M48 family metallopeptidase [Thioalkalivibrio sp. HL-Eb18]|uniref:M48 family metallopeptidase n=1 Tax=Thioalkalivibrio sp. HL-Eb18 TaxID=1266913 RepID=UPI000374289F|nr:M48 family metallopeptidase [Thioalkalivibrio sp. HL-Eb18]
MNFFEHQDRAQRRTRWLLGLFMLAVLAIVVVMNLIALVLFGQAQATAPGEPWLTREFLRDNLEVVGWTSAFTVGLIGLGSLYRMLSLRDGGGAVARELGGTRVEGDTRDPLRRRLMNVVEEVAIASGVPVPEVYVLEQEPGINAFAAGYSPSDAAIAVTRGALEHLNRAELQGVVAHEFGHILNGDMRMNIRLVGMLFGILVMALIGQRVLLAMRFSRNNRNAGGIVVAGLVLMIVGYIGLFFGRWIRASVSRQREYLADASAVQFTRQPEGIAGALKKIGASYSGLNANSEEVGHMLFVNGGLGRMFATHPPLEDRIRKIEPGFDPSELKALHKRMQEDARRRREEQEAEAAREQAEPKAGSGLGLHPEALLDAIGDPGLAHILGAGFLVAAVPSILERSVHSDRWAAEAVLYLLISPDSEVRDAQLMCILETRGEDSEKRVRELLQEVPELSPDLRIPLLEMAFPVLRRHPPQEREVLSGLVDELIQADGRVSAFEYALGRLVRRHLRDVERPSQARSGGRRRLADNSGQARYVLAVLAHHGHPDDAEAAVTAFNAGVAALTGIMPLESEAPPELEQATAGTAWASVLDKALERLDQLRVKDKRTLVEAMLATVQRGGGVQVAEIELLRAMAAALHIPLPIAEMADGSQGSESHD